MACLQGMMQLVMMQRQIVFLGGDMKKRHLQPTKCVRLSDSCTFLTLLDVGTIQTCSSLAGECWCLPAPRLSRWLWAQRAGHQDGWAQSLTLSYPDGSLSQQAAHQNGRRPDDRQRWIRHLPLASLPLDTCGAHGGMRGWSMHTDWAEAFYGTPVFSSLFRPNKEVYFWPCKPRFSDPSVHKYSVYIWRPIKLTWKTENNNWL